jgi:hypothetical protein
LFLLEVLFFLGTPGVAHVVSNVVNQNVFYTSMKKFKLTIGCYIKKSFSNWSKIVCWLITEAFLFFRV